MPDAWFPVLYQQKLCSIGLQAAGCRVGRLALKKYRQAVVDGAVDPGRNFEDGCRFPTQAEISRLFAVQKQKKQE